MRAAFAIASYFFYSSYFKKCIVDTRSAICYHFYQLKIKLLRSDSDVDINFGLFFIFIIMIMFIYLKLHISFELCSKIA